jgi:AcrR family transcriptional regulator
MPRSSREKSEETRARIIEAAFSLFLERGYHGTSMRDVSQRTGVTVGAIYNHFPTKEDLWKEVLFTKHPYHEMMPVLQAADGDTIAELVRSAAGLLVQGLLKRPDLFNLLFIELVEFNSAHVPEFFQIIFPQVVKLSGKLDQKTGKLRDIPMVTLLRSFLGLFFSYYVTGTMLKGLGGVTTDPQSLDQFVDVYLYGLLADDDPSRPGAGPKPPTPLLPE